MVEASDTVSVCVVKPREDSVTDDLSAVVDEWLLSEVDDTVTVPAKVEDLLSEDVLVPVEPVVETVSVLVVTLEAVLVDDSAGGGGSGYRLAHEHTYAERIAVY